MFAPVTKWSAILQTAEAAPEMLRKAFKLAQTERPGSVYLAIPEDLEAEAAPQDARPLPVNVPRPDEPSSSQLDRAVAVLRASQAPIILAGHGVARAGAESALRYFAETTALPVATTFHGKGVLPDDHPQALGAVGFMAHDYVNFGFDRADTIVAVGFELQEFDPVRINPAGTKSIVHVHRFPAEVDRHYNVTVGLQGDIGRTLESLANAVGRRFEPTPRECRIRSLLANELEQGRSDDRFPLAPARVVADIRSAMGRDDVVLVDTGALKMWMARLYPTYAPNTCLISNGLSTMGWAVPGALGAALARPMTTVLAVTGDGGFLMNSQEIETAIRFRLPITILIWVDDHYGLIQWKMEIELGHHVETGFSNPDFVAYTESFGALGYRVESANDLLPTLRDALSQPRTSVVACPVDYSANLALTNALGQLDEPI